MEEVKVVNKSPPESKEQLSGRRPSTLLVLLAKCWTQCRQDYFFKGIIVWVFPPRKIRWKQMGLCLPTPQYLSSLVGNKRFIKFPIPPPCLMLGSQFEARGGALSIRQG